MPKKKVEDFLYEKESYEIRGVCFRIYNTLGGGIKEKIIEKVLQKELIKAGMKIETQKRIDVFYDGEKIATYIPDMVVNEKIMIELKSKPFITKSDEKQFWGYLKGTSFPLGFLINFGPQKLEIKRYAHTRL